MRMLLMLPTYSAMMSRSRIEMPSAKTIPPRPLLLAITSLLLMAAVGSAFAASPAEREKNNFYLPSKTQSQVVSVSTAGDAQAEIIVLTEAVAVKETGPKETVAKFGEVYAFAPSFIAVHQDEPTRLTFWNLQADDEHDFMLA